MKTKPPSRFEAFNRFVDFAAKHCRPAEVRVWLYLWRRANRSGMVKFRLADVSEATGVNRRHIKDAVEGLRLKACLGVKWGNNWQHHQAKVEVHEAWERGWQPSQRDETYG